MIRYGVLAGLMGVALASGADAQGVKPISPQASLDQAMASGRPYFTSDQPGDSVSFRERGGEPQKMSTDAFAAFVQARFSGRTVIAGDSVHGWQVEYTSPEGSAYLWYPENERLVVGHWRVKTDTREVVGKTYRTVNVCFSYPNSYNPATGAGPDQEECVNAWFVLGSSGFSSSEWRAGDPFKLAAGVMPYKRAKTDKPAWP